MSPVTSDDLTEIIEEIGGRFVVLRSPESAEHDPNYVELGSFATRERAADYLTFR